MSSDSKVFDVASPGSSKPETGSKPMVVGHKMMQDPTVKSTDATEEKPAEIMTTRSEKTIKPLGKSKEPKSDDSVELPEDKKTETRIEEAVVNESSTQDKSTEAEPVAGEVAIEESKIPEKPAAEQEVNDEDVQLKSEDNLEVEREDRLQEMIKSKEYYAPIQVASLSSAKTFLTTFFVVALVGLLVLVLLIDMEVLDVGVSLPFDIL